MDCLFCKIINKEISAEIIYEDEKFIVFKDINPKAPVHFLVVPKKHIESIQDITEEEKGIITNLVLTARKIAKEKNFSTEGEFGYKLVFNVGRGGGQLIPHLHLHLLANWKRSEDRNIPGMP
jgi:histidine triad (HIT) family protein